MCAEAHVAHEPRGAGLCNAGLILMTDREIKTVIVVVVVLFALIPVIVAVDDWLFDRLGELWGALP